MTVIYHDPKGRRALTRLEGNPTLQTVARRCDRVTELVQPQQGQFVRYNCVFGLRDLLQSTVLPYAHLAKAKGIEFKVSFPANFPIWLLGSTLGPMRPQWVEERPRQRSLRFTTKKRD